MLKIFIFLCLTLNTYIGLYISSNSSSIYDGSSPSKPLNNISIAINLILNQLVADNSIILLPSSTNYMLENLITLNSSINFFGLEESPALLYLERSFILESSQIITFKWLTLSRQNQANDQNLFYLNSGSELNMNFISIQGFRSTNNLNYFIKGKECVIIFKNSSILANDFGNMQNFIQIETKSRVIFQSCLLKDIILLNSSFIQILDIKSSLEISHSTAENFVLSTENSDDALYGSFILSYSNMSFLNNSFINFSFDQGAFLRFLTKKPDKIYIDFKYCYFKDFQTKGSYLFLFSNGECGHISFEEIYFFNNTIYVELGTFIYVDNGDFLDFRFSSVIMKNNYVIMLQTYYVNSSFFDKIYIHDHNIRNTLEQPFKPNYFSYLESTVYLSFNCFIIDGAYSDRDVAGLKVHVNNAIYPRNNNFYGDLFSKSPKIDANFTDCLFTRTTSYASFWMDKGSAMSFHSDLPLYVSLIRTHMIDNEDEFGSTCLECYGQGQMKLIIMDSFFINNTAGSGTTCLFLYIMSFSMNNSYFIQNTMISKPRGIIDFKEGTQGTLYGETNNILITSCFFFENAAYHGGLFYFFAQRIGLLNLKILKSTFKNNQAKLGGVLSITNVYTKISLVINESNFLGNQGFNGGCFYLAFISQESSIIIANNSFISNAGLKGGVCFSSVDGFQSVYLNNLYDSNYAWNFTDLTVLAYGGVHYLSEEASSDLFNLNNIYKNNTSSHAGGVYSINRGTTSENQAKFLSNAAENQAGTIYMRNSGICKIKNTVFENEKSNIWGGSVYLCENSVIYIENSQFSNCLSRSGGAFYFENYGDILINASSFVNNSAYEGGVAVIDSSSNNMTLIGCEFSKHPSQQFLFQISSILGFTNFLNLIFKDNDCPIFDMSNSYLYFTKSYVLNQNCSGSTSACILSLKDSYSTLTFLEITNTTINQEGELFFSQYGHLVYNENIFINEIHGISKNGCGNIFSSNYEIKNSSFYSTGYSCFLFTSSNIFFNSVVFDNLNNSVSKNSLVDNTDYGSYIFVTSGQKTIINSSLFKNNLNDVALNGGALKSLNAMEDSLFEIYDCEFDTNIANSKGGAIFFYKQKFFIENCSFNNNSAHLGGAIFFQSEIHNLTQKYIVNSIFKLNSADEGGAIYFYDNLTDLNSNIYQNNTAPYGQNIGSFPVYFRFRMYDISNLTYLSSKVSLEQLNDSMIIYDSFQKDINELVIEKVPTGEAFNVALVFDVLDYYMKPITSINSGWGHLRSISRDYFNKSSTLSAKAISDNEKNQNKYDFSNEKVSFDGDIDDYNENGTFFFSFLKIHGTPSSYINLFITNDMLTLYLPKIVGNNYTFVEINGTIGLILTLHLSECYPGELYLRDENYCSMCSPGKYSLSTTDKICLDCPGDAQCLGGNKISINYGYWKTPEENALNIFKCNNYEAACIGGIENKCLEGYKGPLCSICKFDDNDLTPYTKLGKYCVICMNDGLNALFLIALFLFFIVIVYFINRSNMKVTPETFISKQEDMIKSPNTSLFFKILVDHIQLIGITENIGFDVPSYFQMTSDIQSNSVYFFQQMLSFDCFLKHRNFTDNADNSIMFLRVMCVALLPFACAIALSIIWLIYFKYRSKEKKVTIIKRMIASIIVTIFLIQPTILNIMTNMIGCIQLGNTSYVLADMSLTCWGSDHIFLVLVFAIPSLALWIVVFPLFCLISIAKKRKNLKNEDTVLKFGFLYNGFHEKKFYWGFVKYFQKVLIILIRLSDIDLPIKMLTLLSILIISVSFEKFKRSYVHKSLNMLEFASNIVTLLTLFFGLYFLLGVSSEWQVIIYLIILIGNLGFLVYWLRAVFLAKKKDLMRSLSSFKKRTKVENLSSVKRIVPLKSSTKFLASSSKEGN